MKYLQDPGSIPEEFWSYLEDHCKKKKKHKYCKTFITLILQMGNTFRKHK